MRAEGQNGRARREGYCWVTAGRHAHTKQYKNCLKNGSIDLNKTRVGYIELPKYGYKKINSA
jgi:hypothetical protein